MPGAARAGRPRRCWTGTGSWPPRSGIARRGPGTRICTPMSWSPTSSTPRPMTAGPPWTPARCTGGCHRSGTSTRRSCAGSSPAGSASSGARSATASPMSPASPGGAPGVLHPPPRDRGPPRRARPARRPGRAGRHLRHPHGQGHHHRRRGPAAGLAATSRSALGFDGPSLGNVLDRATRDRPTRAGQPRGGGAVPVAGQPGGLDRPGRARSASGRSSRPSATPSPTAAGSRTSWTWSTGSCAPSTSSP